MSDELERLRVLTDRIGQYARGVRYAQPTPPPAASSAGAGGAGASPLATSAASARPHAPHPHATHAPLPAHSHALTRQERLKALYARIAACVACPLHEGRLQTVPGSGVLDPDVMVIGEAPGANEDKYGKPFIGRAGQYLDKWLESIGIHRTKNAYIANIIKCRPPQNRDPHPAEIVQCKPYLEEQIDLVNPKVLLIAGRIAAHHLFDISDSLATMRTQQRTFRNTPALITYHPSAVLRNQNLRRPVWEDLQKLTALIAEQQ